MSQVDGAHAWLSVWARPSLEGLAKVYADAPACPGYVSTQRRTPYGDVPSAQLIGRQSKKEQT